MYDREYFEEQSRQLKMQCAVRRYLRAKEKNYTKSMARRVADRIHNLGQHEADLLKVNERAEILMRNMNGESVNEIAHFMNTDILTVAAVIEGVV